MTQHFSALDGPRPAAVRFFGGNKRLCPLLRHSGLLLSIGLLASCGSRHAENQVPKAAPPAGRLVLTGVTVVDTHDGQLTPDQSIVMEGGKILSITPAGTAPTGGQVVDARGQFVVPGYLDMHAHALGPDDPSAGLALLLAEGVTGFRQMQGSPELLEQRRAGTLPLGADAPELLAMPGSILTPVNAGTPEAAVAEVRAQKAAGADFIKVALVGVPAFFAAEAEAKRLGLPFVGHLPEGVEVGAASQGGMKSIEHMGPGGGLLVACSTEETALREELTRLPPVKGPPNIPFLGKLLAGSIQKRLINPTVSSTPESVARIQRAIDTYSDAKDRQLAARFIANRTWQVPTLIRLRTMYFGDAPEYRTNPNLRYLPAATVQQWQDVAQEFTTKLPATSKATYQSLYALQLKLVKLFEETHVPMLAGSDYGGGWLVPGFSLHQEFDELQKAGLSPLTILQMTTLNGATFLGRTATMGSVEAGKNANLVLLDANPLADPQNLHKVHAVVRAGRYYAPADLENLKRKVLAQQAAL